MVTYRLRLGYGRDGYAVNGLPLEDVASSNENTDNSRLHAGFLVPQLREEDSIPKLGGRGIVKFEGNLGRKAAPDS
jgi:hypothetical protein